MARHQDKHGKHRRFVLETGPMFADPSLSESGEQNPIVTKVPLGRPSGHKHKAPVGGNDGHRSVWVDILIGLVVAWVAGIASIETYEHGSRWIVSIKAAAIAAFAG